MYGLVGMIPGARHSGWPFDLPSGASLLAAIIVLAVMILPSIISVSETALRAVPQEYEEASLALGATHIETMFRVSSPPPAAASPPPWCWASAGPSARPWPSSWWRATWPTCRACSPRALPDHRHRLGDVLRLRGLSHRKALFSIGLVLFLFIMLINVFLNVFIKTEKRRTEPWKTSPSPRRRLYDRGLRVLLYLRGSSPAPCWCSSSAISSTGGSPNHLGAPLHPDQLYQRHHRHPAQYPQHPLYHPAWPW